MPRDLTLITEARQHIAWATDWLNLTKPADWYLVHDLKNAREQLTSAVILITKLEEQLKAEGAGRSPAPFTTGCRFCDELRAAPNGAGRYCPTHEAQLDRNDALEGRD